MTFPLHCRGNFDSKLTINFSYEKWASRLAFFVLVIAMRQENLTQIETLILPILDDLGYELVDLQLQQDGKQMALRIFVDKPLVEIVEDLRRLQIEVVEVDGAIDRGDIDQRDEITALLDQLREANRLLEHLLIHIT